MEIKRTFDLNALSRVSEFRRFYILYFSFEMMIAIEYDLMK